ncbi:anti-RNA polymerase sigma factor SigE [Thiorhodovibrio winogradskyi]|uniref:Anti-RNA polymerase sigma factor SigE n=1 Tax=Thiorhodovibrio winogradskyi TaxID=77007 RepID=A0ABZ0S8H2_9GAMM|nr:sigma-E factor negative regulatory protein [Thiorhodovibrio winogradskyi]
MTQRLAEEQLSVLLDQDTDPTRVEAALAQLNQDVGLRERWGRYHLIRGALRGDSVRADYHGIAARVSERLDCEHPDQREATAKAPGMTEVEKASGAADRLTHGTGILGVKAMGIGGRQNLGFKGRTTTWLPLTGAALAGMMALGLTSLMPETLPPKTLPEFAELPSLSPAPLSAPLSGQLRSEPARRELIASDARSGSGVVSLPRGGLVAGEVVPWATSHPRLTSKLNYLVVGHQERVSASGIKGFLPYATLVGYQVQP